MGKNKTKKNISKSSKKQNHKKAQDKNVTPSQNLNTKKSKKEIRKENFQTFIKKTFKAFIIVSIIGTIFLTWLLSETETTQYPDPTEYFFIEDYSQVFTEETEQFIMTQAVALQDATKAQIVVVAVPNTQADSLENFSYNLAKSWGIGDSQLNNGVLILFTTNTSEPHVRMEVGRGLEGCLPDAKAGRILDDWAVDAKDNGRWNEAAINTWVETAKVVYQEYGLEPPNDLTTVEKDTISEKVTKTTMADAIFPEVLVEKSEDPLYIQICSAFFMLWFFGFIPFLFICIVSAFNGGSSGKGSSSSSDGYYSSDSSSYSGGGGDFDGGGASR